MINKKTEELIVFYEGERLIGCSTNGQKVGLWVSGQDWGSAAGCSFTTAENGAAIFQSVTNWELTGGEYAVAGATPAAAGINIDSSCSDFTIVGVRAALNTYGILVAGTRHTLSGNNCRANSNVDIYINNATKLSVTSNVCDSTGVAWSILEAGTANYNAIGLNVTNGTVTVVGANSAASNNIVY